MIVLINTRNKLSKPIITMEKAMFKNIILLFLMTLTLSACNLVEALPVSIEKAITAVRAFSGNEQNQAPTEAQAHLALEEFFVLLNQGQYERAVRLYGGSYEVLTYFNPDLAPEDKAGLLQAACELNGFMCLSPLSITLSIIEIRENQPQEFVFEVTFANPDGSEFVLGPCCGADEETMPPQTYFTVRVACDNDTICQVLDLPPYVP